MVGGANLLESGPDRQIASQCFAHEHASEVSIRKYAKAVRTRPKAMRWSQVFCIALVASSTRVASTGSQSTPPVCLGFLLPDPSFAITSARCAGVETSLGQSDENEPPPPPDGVVLVGVNRAPVLAPVFFFVLEDEVFGDKDSDAKPLVAAEWPVFQVAVGMLQEEETVSAVVFPGPSSSRQAGELSLGRERRWLRYDVVRVVESASNAGHNGSLNSTLSSTDRALDDGASANAASPLADGFTLQHSEIQIVGNSECEAVAGKPIVGSQKNRVLCGRIEWASVEACEAVMLTGGDGQLVTEVQDDGVEYAVGFVAETFPCGSGDPVSSIGKSSSSLFVVVPAVNPWDKPNTSASASGSSDAGSSASSPEPVEPSTDSSSALEPVDPIETFMPGIGSGGGGSSMDGGEEVAIPSTSFRFDVRYPFVYLSSTKQPTTKSIPAVMLWSDFVVTSADWITDSEQIKWVLFNDRQTAVKKLWFPNSTDNAGIVLVELAETNTMYSIAPIALPPPRIPSADDTFLVQLSFLDPVLLYDYDFLPTNRDAQLAPQSACRDGFYCVQSSSQEFDGIADRVTARMGFVLLGDQLVGLVTGSTDLVTATRMTTFLHIGSPVRKTFIDLVAHTPLKWATGDVYSKREWLYHNTAVQIGLAGDGDNKCGGVIIATTYVLTSASCAVNNRGARISYGTEPYRLDLQVRSDVVVHPMYQRGGATDPTYDLAILTLVEAVSSTHTMPLAIADLAVGAQATRVELARVSGTASVRLVEDSECARSSTLLTTSGITVCTRASQNDSAIGFSKTTALMGDRPSSWLLLGLQVAQASDNVGFASVVRVADFINAHVTGHRWEGDKGEYSAADFKPLFVYPFAYLSSSGEASDMSVAAVHISPSIVLTSAEWLDAAVGASGRKERMKWVLFGDDTIAIADTQSEQEYRDKMGLPSSASSSSTSNLVMVKLARPYVRKQPLTPSNVTIEVKFADPILLWRGLPRDSGLSYLDSSPSAACSQALANNGTAFDGVDCVRSTLQGVQAFALGTPMRMGFQLTNGVVSGVSMGVQSLAADIAVPFARLDYEPRKMFINTTTSIWNASDNVELPADKIEYGRAAVRLLASGQFVDCGGMLIAPHFVLTTASCVLRYNITGVTYGYAGGGAGTPVSVLWDETVTHPHYRVGNEPTLRYNLAILKLSLAVPPESSPSSATPVALAPLDQPVGSEVVRVDLSDGRDVTACVVLPSGRCPIRTGVNEGSNVGVSVTERAVITAVGSNSSVVPTPNTTSALPSGIVCAGNDSVAPSKDQPYASAALLAKFNGTVVLIGLQVGPDNDRFADSYASVREAANFINAYVYDHVWGRPSGDPGANEPGEGTLVGLRISKSGQNFCGAALIASQFVLTAAHCVTDGLVQWVAIRSVESGNEVEVIKVETDRIHIHPSFGSPNAYSFDAAILELKTPSIQIPSTLGGVADFADKIQAGVVTSGVTKSSDKESSYVTLVLPLWSQTSCEATIPDVDYSVVCAGGDAQSDACVGDSGSPLIDPESSRVIGLVSSGYGCGRVGVPGLYTRVAAIRDFIASYTAPAASDEPQTLSPAPVSSSNVPRSPTSSPASSQNSGPSPTPGSSGGIGGGSTDIVKTPTPVSTARPSNNNGNKFPGAITNQPLPTTTDITRDKVTNWLLGTGTDSLTGVAISDGLQARLTSLSNDITLYSTGDLRGIARVIAAHDALPLNQREDRFGSASARHDGVEPRSAREAC